MTRDECRVEEQGDEPDLVEVTAQLLLNLQNPQEILAEMVRITKPGGVVAVQEPVAAAWTCDPAHPAFDVLRATIISAYRRTGKDFNIGRRITRMLTEAGCSDVRVRATARVTQPGDYYHTFLLTIAELVREVIVQAGELTGDELDSYTQTLRRHLKTPGTITCQPLILQAWGQTANP